MKTIEEIKKEIKICKKDYNIANSKHLKDLIKSYYAGLCFCINEYYCINCEKKLDHTIICNNCTTPTETFISH